MESNDHVLLQPLFQFVGCGGRPVRRAEQLSNFGEVGVKVDIPVQWWPSLVARRGPPLASGSPVHGSTRFFKRAAVPPEQLHFQSTVVGGRWEPTGQPRLQRPEPLLGGGSVGSGGDRVRGHPGRARQADAWPPATAWGLACHGTATARPRGWSLVADRTVRSAKAGRCRCLVAALPAAW